MRHQTSPASFRGDRARGGGGNLEINRRMTIGPHRSGEVGGVNHEVVNEVTNAFAGLLELFFLPTKLQKVSLYREPMA